MQNDFATKDKGVRAEGVRLTKAWVEAAARLGAPVIRVFAGPHNNVDWRDASGQTSREEVERWMADDLRECAEHGKKFGVIVAVQNHGDFLNSAPEHLSLLKRVDHEWCGALVDTGKYLTDDPYADIASMVPHAVNWQIDLPPLNGATFSERISCGANQGRARDAIREEFHGGAAHCEAEVGLAQA